MTSWLFKMYSENLVMVNSSFVMSCRCTFILAVTNCELLSLISFPP
jgi:hypothetical protein